MMCTESVLIAMLVMVGRAIYDALAENAKGSKVKGFSRENRSQWKGGENLALPLGIVFFPHDNKHIAPPTPFLTARACYQDIAA